MNGEAYTSQAFSIGPFHHNSERLQPKKNHKVRYFKSLVQRANPRINLKNLVNIIRVMEKEAFLDAIRRPFSLTVMIL